MKLKRILGFTLSAAMLITSISMMPTKEAKADNPIVQHIFAPDPAPMVYDDTVYLYTTHDEDETVNGFYTMLNWHCFSSKDMVNWTAHGQMWGLDDLSWANDRAWAAQCVEKDGKFYMYVPVKATNSGICIGVGVSDSPTGPFVDAIGGPLVDEGDWNDIDPTVYIDDDGQAYLYFGNPQLRYVKLNDDMISYDKSVGVVKNEMTAEAFGDRGNGESSYAEGPWFYKRNDKYYMVYPAFHDGTSENISYSTSDSPTGPWTFGGVILEPNNCYTIHPGVVDYKGHSFLFYHNNILDKTSSFHRSVSLEEFTYEDDGSISKVEQTTQGVDPVDVLNPYSRVEAETIAWERGVDIENCVNGGCNVNHIHNDNYIKVKNVDFGNFSPLSVTANAACASAAEEGKIEFRIDCNEDIDSTTSSVKGLFDEGYDLHNTDVNTGELIASIDISSTGSADTFKDVKAKLEKEITGVHDLYIVFKSAKSDELFKFDYWSFEKDPQADVTPVPPTAAPTAMPTAAPATAAPTAVPAATVAPATAAPATNAPTAEAAPKLSKTQIKSVTNSAKGTVKLSIKKNAKADGYQLIYASNKKFTKGKKIIKVKKTGVVIKKLKKGTTYYFKVRAYKSANNKTYYGKYGAVKRLKIRK